MNRELVARELVLAAKDLIVTKIASKELIEEIIDDLSYYEQIFARNMSEMNNVHRGNDAKARVFSRLDLDDLDNAIKGMKVLINDNPDETKILKKYLKDMRRSQRALKELKKQSSSLRGGQPAILVIVREHGQLESLVKGLNDWARRLK